MEMILFISKEPRRFKKKIETRYPDMKTEVVEINFYYGEKNIGEEIKRAKFILIFLGSELDFLEVLIKEGLESHLQKVLFLSCGCGFCRSLHEKVLPEKFHQEIHLFGFSHFLDEITKARKIKNMERVVTNFKKTHKLTF